MKFIIRMMCIFWLSHHAVAGVMPSQTRLLFNENSAEHSLMLVNTNAYPVLVQTWVDRGQGTPDATAIPFVTLPPVFRLEPQGIKGLRILVNHASLPRNRESLYWLNIYEIPPEKRGETHENSVLVTMNTQLKVFWRPAGIHITPDIAIAKVTCRRAGPRELQCHNPSPVHLSVIALQVSLANGTASAVDAEQLMLPFSDKRYHLNQAIPERFSVTFCYVDDDGEQQRFFTEQ